MQCWQIAQETQIKSWNFCVCWRRKIICWGDRFRQFLIIDISFIQSRQGAMLTNSLCAHMRIYLIVDIWFVKNQSGLDGTNRTETKMDFWKDYICVSVFAQAVRWLAYMWWRENIFDNWYLIHSEWTGCDADKRFLLRFILIFGTIKQD